MKLRSRTVFAATGAAFAIAGAGGALAAGSGAGATELGTTGTAVGGPGIAIRLGPGPGPPAAIADYLGVSEDELRTELESGKTLAQVASAHGKSVSGLEDLIYADAKSRLDQAVASGKLASEQEQAMLAELKSHLDEIVNSTGPHLAVKGAGEGPTGGAAAAYLGLTPAELQTRLENGKTLAQVAADQGKPVEGVKAAILAGAKSDLDAAAADGKITAAQEQEMLADLASHVDDLVNGAGLIQKTVSS